VELELPGQGSEYLRFLLNETFFYIEITTAKNGGGDILFLAVIITVLTFNHRSAE
jgi:hypothetical protein